MPKASTLSKERFSGLRLTPLRVRLWDLSSQIEEGEARLRKWSWLFVVARGARACVYTRRGGVGGPRPRAASGCQSSLRGSPRDGLEACRVALLGFCAVPWTACTRPEARGASCGSHAVCEPETS